MALSSISKGLAFLNKLKVIIGIRNGSSDIYLLMVAHFKTNQNVVMLYFFIGSRYFKTIFVR